MQTNNLNTKGRRYIAKTKKKEPEVNLEKRLNAKGYIEIFTGELEHRYNYKRRFGFIPTGWIIHHIDCNKKNNDISNLICLPEKFHSIIHVQMRKNNRRFCREEINHLLAAYSSLKIKK